MKRDMELIRLILLDTEGEERLTNLAEFTEEQQIYHSALLIEAGLIDGVIQTDGKASCILDLYPHIAALVAENKPPALWRIGKHGVAHAVEFVSILQRMRRNRRL